MPSTAEAYLHISLLCCIVSLYLNLNGIGHTGTERKITVKSDGPIGFSSYVRSQSHVNMRLDHYVITVIFNSSVTPWIMELFIIFYIFYFYHHLFHHLIGLYHKYKLTFCCFQVA